MSPGWGHADLFGPIVAPEVRGRELGTILLEASIERAEDRGAQRVLASVGTRNMTGQLLLERVGFQRYGTANAIYRLGPTDHRPVQEGPVGVTVRRGVPDDLDAASTSTASAFRAVPSPRRPGERGSKREASTSRSRRSARSLSSSIRAIGGSTTSA